MNHPTRPPIALPTLYSRAPDWRSLRAFVHDALADAYHHRAALSGARPNFSLIISRRHLPLHLLSPKEVDQRLQKFSSELHRQGVIHRIHWVVAGNSEPAQHELRISLN